jgi:hypothetical protein
MKVFKFPNDKSLILFEKSGSSLIGMLFKSLSDWKGIEIDNHIDLKHGDLTLIVRNPLERFISGFFHTNFDVNVTINMETDWNNIIDKFDKYLTRYENPKGEIHNDPHSASQLYTFYNNDIDIRENPKCSIFHLEDIDNGFSNLIEEWKGSGNFNYVKGSAAEFFTEEQFHTNLPIFKHLEIELDKWDMFHLIIFYHFQLYHLNSFHHRGISWEFLQGLKRYKGGLHYGRIVKLFYNENYTLKYNMGL